MLNHAHHTYYVHFGEHKAAIVTDQHPDGSVDLVYFNGGSDGMPHAATNVKHSALGEDGTFHHDSNFVYDMTKRIRRNRRQRKPIFSLNRKRKPRLRRGLKRPN